MDGLELAGQWRENPEICQTQDTTLLPEIYPTQCIKNKQNISMQKQVGYKKRQKKTNFCLRPTYLYESKIAPTKSFFKYPNHMYMKD